MTKKITKARVQEVGMLLVLGFLLSAFFLKNEFYLKGAILLLVLNLTVPILFYPLARIWFGLADLLGSIASKIFLSLAFFLVVSPVGWIRRILRHDILDLKKFKKSRESVLKNSNSRGPFQPADLEKTY